MLSDLAESYDPHAENPYPFYAEARRREPVFYSPRVDAWLVTRFADVEAVLKDWTGFSSVNSLRPIRPLYPATLSVLAEGFPQRPDHVTSDGEAHRRLRLPYTRHLTAPGRVKGLEPGVRTRAESLVDGFAGAGAADLIARFAKPLPLLTATAMFGFAPDDVPTARDGSESLFRLGSADLTEAEEVAAARAVVAFQRLVARYAHRRRTVPNGDLISDVTAALADGDAPLTADQEAELVATITSTFGAGHITTADLIGSALRLLAGHPPQWELLCRRPELIAGAVEEVLRFEAPVPSMFRRATRAATIGGVEIPRGADVLVVFASANRDEERFPDAGRFDVTRKPARHFAFGAGVHTCAGAAAARVQARVALRVLTDRLPGLSVAAGETAPIRRSINVRGPLRLDVRW
ncbi:cytochrome P450 [Catenuloplanes atrovinosus]|uniref:Cytochrome P450 n=1 Tax=Catenuloplanes atrovinosus TaxID=137266 RepID=A0AAE4C935_9ACTN|nr:cytochrome P450 [Catenuloplanes atrovinosus]MDR7275638.1 cytochrome P450 [Catenuloplanes atrovinosus]